jgi:plastocyanin
MKNKEDIFLIGLILIIIVLVVALFMTPAKVLVVAGEGEATASIDIANPPREAIIQIEPEADIEIVEEKIEEEIEVVEEPETLEEIEMVEIILRDNRFKPNDVTIESGTIVTWINDEDYNMHGIDLVTYSRHTYSPKIRPGESWSIALEGPTVYYFNAVGFESRKGRITVKAPKN